MRLASAKSFVGTFFLGRYVVEKGDTRAGIVIERALGGFDKFEDAEAQMGMMKLQHAGETYFVVEVRSEFRTKINLIEVVPA